MPKESKLRRVELPSTLPRGSSSGGAVPTVPSAPVSPTPATTSITGLALSEGAIAIGDSFDLAAERTLAGDAAIDSDGIVTLSGNDTARTNLGTLGLVTGLPGTVVAGLPTVVPTQGVGTSEIARITRGADVVPVPYYYAQNANDSGVNSWWRFDQRWVVGESAIGAFIAG